MDPVEAGHRSFWRRLWSRLEAFDRAMDWTPTQDVEARATRLERRLALLEARFDSAAQIRPVLDATPPGASQ